jgi:hypothetical protein
VLRGSGSFEWGPE